MSTRSLPLACPPLNDEAALKESGVRYSLVQEFGDGWTLQFGLLSAAEVSKAFTAFVR